MVDKLNFQCYEFDNHSSEDEEKVTKSRHKSTDNNQNNNNDIIYPTTTKSKKYKLATKKLSINKQNTNTFSIIKEEISELSQVNLKNLDKLNMNSINNNIDSDNKNNNIINSDMDNANQNLNLTNKYTLELKEVNCKHCFHKNQIIIDLQALINKLNSEIYNYETQINVLKEELYHYKESDKSNTNKQVSSVMNNNANNCKKSQSFIKHEFSSKNLLLKLEKTNDVKTNNNNNLNKLISKNNNIDLNSATISNTKIYPIRYNSEDHLKSIKEDSNDNYKVRMEEYKETIISLNKNIEEHKEVEEILKFEIYKLKKMLLESKLLSYY